MGLTQGRLLALTALVLLALGAAGAAYALSAPWVRGYAYYRGYLPLTARIVGHTFDMAPEAVRCANCHDPGRPGADPRRLPPLTKESLVTPVSRRGAPPTSYDLDKFCSMLAGGIDPAGVLVDRTMPRFTIDADTCAAIWAYVSTR